MNFKKKLDLNGKKALVTGAARGIGRSCVEALCETGAFVTLSDINIDLLCKILCGDKSDNIKPVCKITKKKLEKIII